MKNGVVVKTVVDVINEVFHRNRRFLVIQFEFDIAGGGGEQNVGVTFCSQRLGGNGRER
ncbi:hypothetical protein ACOMYX_02855 [Pantoea agglomerans]